MTAQLAIPFGTSRHEQLRADFERFHADNPAIYELVCRFANEAMDRGFRRYSIATIFERVRWHVHVETSRTDFKLNNNHRAFYARLWMERHPEHPGFFSTREQTSQEEEAR